MMYELKLSEREMQRLIVALESVRDTKIMIPKEIEQILKNIYDEVEQQSRALRLAKEGKGIYESMKIKV